MTTAWTTRSVRGTLLGVSDDGRHLVDRTTGSPWFYLADTAWTLFKRLSPGDVEHYLSTRAAQGFSAIQAYVLRGLDVTNLDGHRPLVDRDPTRLDEGFFGNVDRIVDRANELGLVMALVATMGEHVRHRATSERFRNDEQIFDVDNAFSLRPHPWRALRRPRGHLVPRRGPLADPRGRGRLGCHGPRPQDRQRRAAPRLVPQQRRLLIVGVVPRLRLARLRHHPVDPPLGRPEPRAHPPRPCAVTRQADAGHGGPLRGPP